MSDNLTSVLLALFVVVVPVWLLVNALGRIFGRQRISKSETAAIENIAAIAGRMEQRMAAVERILDADAPGSRNEVFRTGADYERKLG
jgi:phage shock protein B